ncbi:outer membrane protein assembly factor BamA [bacterium]|nr:outer membrane protein assembly factor BamA [bacterium]RQV95526.1 MAG: outer membrane protein assembly factor BamA [bacterium]
MKHIFQNSLSIMLILSLLGIKTTWSAAEGLEIRTIRFQGNSVYSDKTLIKKMLHRPSSLPYSLFIPNKYDESIFQDDVIAIEKFYKDNGYFDAYALPTKIEIDSIHKQVDIEIDITEGEPYIIQSITFLGNTLFPDSTLTEHIQIHSGEIFQTKNLNQSTDALLALYNNRGHLDTSIQPEVRLLTEQSRIMVDIAIIENRSSMIGHIQIQGNQKTRLQVIQRYITFQTGETAQLSKIMESQRKLYQSGLFRSVFISLLPFNATDSTTRDVLIELKEETHINFMTGIGYGSFDRLRAKMEIQHTNLWGMARKASLTLKASSIVRSAELSVTEPWTWGSKWQTDISGLMEFKKEPGYHLKRQTGQIQIGRDWLQRFRMVFALTSAFSRLSHVVVTDETGTARSQKYSFSTSMVYDSRNNLFNTQSGTVIDMSYEIGKIDQMGLKNFSRSILKIKYFLQLSPRVVLGTACEIGWIFMDGGRSAIPLYERYYSGGPNSIRGFQNKKVGPLDQNRNPVGGTFKLVWNAFEMKIDVYKIFGLAFFTDIGNVWEKPELFSVKSLRISPGLGLRINTPIGTGRVDWGINVDPNPGEPRSCIAISMGQPF